VYAATLGGVSISTDGGTSFVTRTTANGLGTNDTYGVGVNGSTVYVATWSGLSISTDGGATFTNKPIGAVRGIFVSGTDVYAGICGGGGLLISRDGGNTFGAPYKLADGLPNEDVHAPFVDGTKVYAPCGAGLAISK
jgi:hypothetical protein